MTRDIDVMFLLQSFNFFDFDFTKDGALILRVSWLIVLMIMMILIMIILSNPDLSIADLDRLNETMWTILECDAVVFSVQEYTEDSFTKLLNEWIPMVKSLDTYKRKRVSSY